MWNYSREDLLIEKASRYAKIAGIVFIVLGVIGFAHPMFMSQLAVGIIAWLVLFAGIFAGYFTWLTDKTSTIGWLKSFALVCLALLILSSPMQGAATLGLLLAFYFFVDAFSNFGLAASNHPQNRWWIWALNGVLSMALGVIFLLNWPVGTAYMVGLFVGISLFFDGIALLMGSSLLGQKEK